MISVLRGLESASAAYLREAARFLVKVADTLSENPLTNSCENISFSLPPFPTSPFSIFVLTIFTSVPFVFLLPILLRYINPLPYLSTIPAPSHQFDPYDDPQSDIFADEQACPQLHIKSSNTIPCYNPATNAILGHVAPHIPSDIPGIVAAARSAQPAWAATTFHERRRVLLVLRDYLRYNHREIVDIACADSGKTALEAALGEMLPTFEKIRWLIREGEKALSPDIRTVGPVAMHKKASVEYSPLGVIAAIAPWNYPLHNFFNPVLASLFTGCAVVVKPSEYSIYSSLHFVRVVRRALELCGHCPDLVQMVVGGADVAATLVKADVDKLFFTGSTAVGRKVAAAAAERLLPVVLELGGKDGFVVCDDADVKHAATICLRGVFQNAGQNCIGVERVFVHENVMERFLEVVVAGARGIRLGLDMGAITMGEKAVCYIQTLVDDAVAKGAKVMVGGRRAQVNEKGTFYEATVLVGVTGQMRIAHEEVFGPVLSVFSWQNDEQVIQMVNNCPFGLGSSVFSRNKRRADRILGELRVGMGNVNDFASNYLCQSMPFGGTKESGSDRFAGIEGLRGCCLAKSVTRDRFPGVKTVIPRAFRYPTGLNAYELASEINELVYGPGFFSKFDNVRNILGMLLFSSWRPRSLGNL